MAVAHQTWLLLLPLFVFVSCVLYCTIPDRPGFRVTHAHDYPCRVLFLRERDDKSSFVHTLRTHTDTITATATTTTITAAYYNILFVCTRRVYALRPRV